jgi:hypothetical protein
MIYYIVAGMLFGAAAFTQGQARWISAWLAAGTLVILGGLRLEVGTDWDAYQEIFNLVGQGESFSDLREENGFLSLIVLIQFFSNSYPVFIFSLFTLSFALKLYAIHLFRADIIVSLCVYFFSAFLIYDVNGLRQGLALGFVLCAGWFAVRAKLIHFLVVMMLAISMHTVALVALPVYGLANFSWLNQQPLRRRLAVAAATMMLGYATSLFLANTDATAYLDLLNLTSRYNHYVDNFDKTFSPLGLGSLQRIFILTWALCMQDRLACSKRTAALLVNTYLVATAIFFLLSFNIEFMARVSFYYKIFDIILIAMIFRSLKTPLEIFSFMAFLGTLLFGSIYQLLNIPDGGLIPYRFQLLN